MQAWFRAGVIRHGSARWKQITYTGEKVFRSTCKPHSVTVPGTAGNHLSGTRVTPRLVQRTRRFLWDGQPQCACFALLPVGFAWPPASLPAPVVSYTTFSPSRTRTLWQPQCPRRNPFSVALAVGLPRLAVSQHRALWSADFPQRAQYSYCPRRDHPVNLNTHIIHPERLRLEGHA